MRGKEGEGERSKIKTLAEEALGENESRKRITSERHYVELMRDGGKRNYMRCSIDRSFSLFSPLSLSLRVYVFLEFDIIPSLINCRE